MQLSSELRESVCLYSCLFLNNQRTTEIYLIHYALKHPSKKRTPVFLCVKFVSTGMLTVSNLVLLHAFGH